MHNPTKDRIDLTSVGALANLIALSFALPGLMPCGVNVDQDVLQASEHLFH